MMRRFLFSFVGLCFAVCCAPAAAEVKLHGLFTDHMVLQQGMDVPVWGTAADGEKVTVSIGDQKVETTGAGGKFRVNLKPLSAGGPHTLVVAGTNTVTLGDVLVGEVWICSGQSNMQLAVAQGETPEKIIAESANPKIRLFTVPRDRDANPRSDVKSSWVECGPTTVGDFSAVGYHFGRALHAKLGVPVGLISCNVGGTAAEEWTSREVLESDEDLKPTLKNDRSTTLYNAMLHPLAPFAIRGAIWYQGESNAGRAEQYRELFPAMIKNWRDLWGQGDFPFLFVQLAPWKMIVDTPGDSDWAELREAQLMTTKNVPKTAMAVITDFGDEKDIHPKPKASVGERLALAARAIAYGEKIVYSGPVCSKMEIRGNEAVLSFDHVGGGLEVRGEKLKGFTIAGADGAFVNADARIDGDKVVVKNDALNEPKMVRFGWANYPVVNLYNKDGLPATPFRTDELPGVTAGRR
ncbi:MAG: sialate O-acetylesterase [Pirellulales bacterium]